MHPHANPQLISWWMRHLHSTAIKDNTYYGASSPPCEKGMAQLPHLVQGLRPLRLHAFVCSPMIRAESIINESEFSLSPAAKDLKEALAEWPRAKGMEGRNNDEPDVKIYLDDRTERFGPGREVLTGEESFEETYDLMQRLSVGLVLHGAWLRVMLEIIGAVRLGVITHGNRTRLWDAWLLSDGDPELFVLFFKILYRKKGFETANITPPYWYGNFFRDSAPGWNQEMGINLHLPPDLRESVA